MGHGLLRVAAACVALAAALGAPPARAQDTFQGFFFDVCGTPTAGALASRCAETPGGGGDVSGDSEDSLLPNQVVSSNEGALIRTRATRRELSERMEELRQEDREAEAGAPTEPRFGFFVSARGSSWDRDATAEERGAEGDAVGLQVGVDWRWTEQLRVGGLFSYERGDSEFDSDAPGTNFTPPPDDGESESDAYLLALYGTFVLSERAYVEGSIGYGLTEYDIERRAVFQESGRAVPQTNVQTSAEPDGGEFLASLGGGYDVSRGALGLGAYARGEYVRTWIESYTERDDTGSGLAMSFDRQTRNSLTAVLGGRASYTLSTRRGVVIPQIRAQYVHEFDDDEQDAAASFLLDTGGNRNVWSGTEPDQDYVELAVGVSAVLPGGWQPFAEFETLLGYADLDRYGWVVGIRGEF